MKFVVAALLGAVVLIGSSGETTAQVPSLPSLPSVGGLSAIASVITGPPPEILLELTTTPSPCPDNTGPQPAGTVLVTAILNALSLATKNGTFNMDVFIVQLNIILHKAFPNGCAQPDLYSAVMGDCFEKIANCSNVTTIVECLLKAIKTYNQAVANCTDSDRCDILAVQVTDILEYSIIAAFVHNIFDVQVFESVLTQFLLDPCCGDAPDNNSTATFIACITKYLNATINSCNTTQNDSMANLKSLADCFNAYIKANPDPPKNPLVVLILSTLDPLKTVPLVGPLIVPASVFIVAFVDLIVLVLVTLAGLAQALG